MLACSLLDQIQLPTRSFRNPFSTMPPRLCQAGSSQRHIGVPTALGVIPDAMRASWDWEVRTDIAPVFVHPGAVPAFEAAVQARVTALWPFRHPLPADSGLDVAYARTSSELGYAARLADLLKCPELAEFSEVDVSHLCSLPHIGTSRDDFGYLAVGEIDTKFQPLTDRRAMRRNRHRVGVFLCPEWKEAYKTRRDAMEIRYPAYPSWWGPYEVPYGCRAELPPVLYYASSKLLRGPDDPSWLIFRAEWAMNVLEDVVYQARSGRLYWVPPALRDDMRTLGISSLLERCSRSVQVEAEQLINFIDRIRWSDVPAVQRFIPGYAGDWTPVFANGDFVWFDAANWRPDLEDGALLPSNRDGSVGVAIDLRGDRVYGSLEGLPSWRGPNPPIGVREAPEPVVPDAPAPVEADRQPKVARREPGGSNAAVGSESSGSSSVASAMRRMTTTTGAVIASSAAGSSDAEPKTKAMEVEAPTVLFKEAGAGEGEAAPAGESSATGGSAVLDEQLSEKDLID